MGGAVTHAAVPLDGVDERAVRVRLQQDAVRVVLHEVEVLQRGALLGALPPRRPPLVRAALQVVLLVQGDARRQQVVHHDEPDVLAAALPTEGRTVDGQADGRTGGWAGGRTDG